MSVILHAHNPDLLVKGKPKTQLESKGTSGDGTVTVPSISGFAVGQMLLIGQLGSERAEISRVHTSTVPSGSTITLNANLVHDHPVGTPVYVIAFDQVEYSRATTLAGSKSVLSTDSINPQSIESIYDDTVNTTGFGFYRFKNSADSSFSDYSGAIPYAGYDPDMAFSIIERALLNAGLSGFTPDLTYTECFLFLNDFLSFANDLNPYWSEAQVHSEELATISTGDWEFDMPDTIAKKNDPKAILPLRIPGYRPIKYAPSREWNAFRGELVHTTMNNGGALADTDTTLTVTNSAAFADSGNILINGDVIAYTGNTRASNLLTGLTGIQSGGHADASDVFQTYQQDVPVRYTIPSKGKIRVYPLCGSVLDNKILYIDYYSRLQRVDDPYDSITITNIQAAVEYVTYRIKKYQESGTLSLDSEDYQKFSAMMTTLLDTDIPSQPTVIRLG